MKNILFSFLLVLITVTTGICQNTFVSFGTSNKHFPNVQVSGTIKNEHGRYMFPANLEKKLAIEDLQTNDIVNPQFQQGILLPQAVDTTQLTDTTSSSTVGTDLIIMFDASADALNNHGSDMKDLAIRVIRLLDFAHGDRFNIIRCGSSPTLHSATWLTDADTADVVNYINNLTSDNTIDLLGAIAGDDSNSLFGLNTAISIGPFKTSGNQTTAVFMIMGNNADDFISGSSLYYGEKCRDPFANDLGIFPNRPLIHGILFTNGGTNDTLEINQDYNNDVRYSDDGDTLFADNRYLMNRMVGVLSLMFAKNNLTNSIGTFTIGNIDMNNLDSIYTYCFNDFQQVSFKYRYGIINIKIQPNSIAMKPDTFKFSFSSSVYGFDKEIGFKNPVKSGVSFNEQKINSSIIVYPSIAINHIRVESEQNEYYRIYSQNGQLIGAPQLSNETITLELPNGAYYIVTAKGQTSKFIVLK